MLAKRIIPCLDIKNGRVVKGVNFVNLTDAGDPVEIAKAYNNSRADEIVFLDISATDEGRLAMIDVVSRAAKEVFIPLTIGGGISSTSDMKKILYAGADKISINSSAVKDPELIKQGADLFGSQCIVVAIDVKKIDDKYKVFINGGKVNTGLNAIEWAKTVEKLGAGEILLTSMDKDGTKSGYDIEITNILSRELSIPIIASGGAGKKEDFLEVFSKTNCDAALAASLFHFRELDIKELKDYLVKNNIVVRI